MLSLSSLIEFLLDMMRDPAAQQDFARDPQAALAARGLAGVTAQDVRDVQPLLADHAGVSSSLGGAHAARAFHADHHSSASSYAHSYGHAAHDPVGAITNVTNAYEVDRSTVVKHMTQEYQQYTTYKNYITDNSIHADHGGTVIIDSFNQDNDGIDLKGATIEDSVITGGDANQSGNEIDSTTTQETTIDDHSTTVIGSHDDPSDVGGHDAPDDANHSYAPDDSTAGSADDGADATHHST